MDAISTQELTVENLEEVDRRKTWRFFEEMTVEQLDEVQKFLAKLFLYLTYLEDSSKNLIRLVSQWKNWK